MVGLKNIIAQVRTNEVVIIDGNQGIPDEARPENVMAMREAVEEYGVL